MFKRIRNFFGMNKPKIKIKKRLDMFICDQDYGVRLFLIKI
jgi:hypothetical protein